jgi:hypothetical protein
LPLSLELDGKLLTACTACVSLQAMPGVSLLREQRTTLFQVRFC